jgi:hypothetical protein
VPLLKHLWHRPETGTEQSGEQVCATLFIRWYDGSMIEYTGYIYTHYLHSINIYIYNVSNLINSSFAKGHQQIWEGPIAYHTFVEIDVWQIWDASLKEQWMKMTYVHRYWYDINLKSGCCYLGRSYRWPHVCTMTDKECPSLTWFLLREFSRWLMCCSQVS